MRIPLAAKAVALMAAVAFATLVIVAAAVREVFSYGQAAHWNRHALGGGCSWQAPESLPIRPSSG